MPQLYALMASFLAESGFIPGLENKESGLVHPSSFNVGTKPHIAARQYLRWMSCTRAVHGLYGRIDLLTTRLGIVSEGIGLAGWVEDTQVGAPAPCRHGVNQLRRIANFCS